MTAFIVVVLGGMEPCGLADNPFTPGELQAKFIRMSAPVIGEAAALRARDAVQRLAELPRVSDLTS